MAHAQIRHALIPAAGKGTRMAPITQILPKELLPIGCIPTLYHILSEAAASGIDDITLIIAPGKEALERYCSTLSLQTPDGRPVRCTTIYQHEQRGLAHALWQAYTQRHIYEPCAVLLPDDLLWWSGDSLPTPLDTLLAEWHDTTLPVVGLHQVDDSALHRYGIIKPHYAPTGSLHITGIVEKPESIHKAPSSYAIVGRYILPAHAGTVLEDMCVQAEQEVLFTNVLARLGGQHGPYGVHIHARWHDVGSEVGYASAWRTWLARQAV